MCAESTGNNNGQSLPPHAIWIKAHNLLFLLQIPTRFKLHLGLPQRDAKEKRGVSHADPIAAWRCSYTLHGGNGSILYGYPYRYKTRASCSMSLYSYRFMGSMGYLDCQRRVSATTGRDKLLLSISRKILQEKAVEMTTMQKEEKRENPEPEEREGMPQHQRCPPAKSRGDRSPKYHEE
jgi:hypothetical protein